jgi:hypothetical protein
MNVYSNRFIVEFDRERDAYLIVHPDHGHHSPLIEIQRETLEAMSYKEAAQFIGERLILLTPDLKVMFEEYLWTNGGHTPPKLV